MEGLEITMIHCQTSAIKVPNYIGKYKVIKTIGKGGFAVVVMAIDPLTNEKVAIKVVDRKEVENQGLLMYLENELRLSARFDHPNIVKVLDILYEPELIMIIMEFVPNGDLQTLIFKGITFTLEEQLHICYQLLQALQYLHERGISHRDVKPENILFDEKFNPKLIDFGLSKEHCKKMHTFCGTTLYMAPEVITCDTYDGSKADVWAFGVTSHILACHCFPWGLKSETQYIKCVHNHDLGIEVIPKGVIGAIIKRSLVLHPQERATVKELLDAVGKIIHPKFAASRSNFERKSYAQSALPRLSVHNSTPLFIRQRAKITQPKPGQLEVRLAKP